MVFTVVMNKIREKWMREAVLHLLRPFGVKEQQLPKPAEFDVTVIYGKRKRGK